MILSNKNNFLQWIHLVYSKPHQQGKKMLKWFAQMADKDNAGYIKH